jgi:hypothetical protein
VKLLPLERKHQHQAGMNEENKDSPLSHAISLHAEEVDVLDAMVLQKEKIQMGSQH